MFSSELSKCIGDGTVPKVGRHPNPLLCMRSIAELRSFVYVFTGRKWPATIHRFPLCEINHMEIESVHVVLYEIVGSELYIERYRQTSQEHSLCRMMRGNLSAGHSSEIFSSELFSNCTLLQPDLRTKEISWSAFTNQITDGDNSSSIASGAEALVCSKKAQALKPIFQLQKQIVDNFLTEFDHPISMDEDADGWILWQRERCTFLNKIDNFMTKLNAPRRSFYACVALLDRLVAAVSAVEFSVFSETYQVGCISIACKLHWEKQPSRHCMKKFFGILDEHEEGWQSPISTELAVMKALQFKLNFLNPEEVAATILNAEELPSMTAKLVALLLDYSVRLCTSIDIPACAIGVTVVRYAAKLTLQTFLDRCALFSRIPAAVRVAADAIVRDAHRNAVADSDTFLRGRYSRDDSLAILKIKINEAILGHGD